MVNEAEQYKAEDAEASERIAARNGLESYVYNLKNSIEGDLKDKIDAADAETLTKAITETIAWMGTFSHLSRQPVDVLTPDLNPQTTQRKERPKSTQVTRRRSRPLPILS